MFPFKNTLWIGLVVVVIIGGAAFLLTDVLKNSPQPESGETPIGNVVVTKTDLVNAQGRDRIPARFPKDMPTETSSVSESYSVTYADTGTVQSGFVFSTNKSQKEIFAQYIKYMTDAGYAFGGSGKNEAQRFLYGKKDNSHLSVVISPSNGQTLVQLSYTEKK